MAGILIFDGWAEVRIARGLPCHEVPMLWIFPSAHKRFNHEPSKEQSLCRPDMDSNMCRDCFTDFIGRKYFAQQV